MRQKFYPTAKNSFGCIGGGRLPSINTQRAGGGDEDQKHAKEVKPDARNNGIEQSQGISADWCIFMNEMLCQESAVNAFSEGWLKDQYTPETKQKPKKKNRREKNVSAWRLIIPVT